MNEITSCLIISINIKTQNWYKGKMDDTTFE